MTARTTSDAPPAPRIPELRHERFRIGDKLGEGGMGVVYRALDTRDGRDVALKLMKALARRHGPPPVRARVPLALGPAPPALPERLRLRRAGRRPLLHHGAVPGQADHQPGGGRRRRTCSTRLLPVTLALDYIHHHGIVHRDVKPSNILVRPATRPDGSPGFEAKLMDFGLAKYYGVKSSLSAEAGFVGTVAYCARSSSTTTSSTTAPTSTAWGWSATSC